MHNVVENQLQVLVERQKSFNDGDWINPGKAKQDRRQQKSVDAKRFQKKAQREKSVPKPLPSKDATDTTKNQLTKRDKREKKDV